jgi:hypothetical protein
VNQTLGLYPATKHSSKSQKTAILKADFFGVLGPQGSQNCPSPFLSQAGILLKAPIEVAI